MSLLDAIDKSNLPQHVAFIMDGNGRWAKKLGQMRLFGHQKGVKTVRSILETAGNLGIKYVTVYAFSTENWNRPQTEVNGIMDLLVKSIDEEIDTMMKNGIKIFVIGQIDRLPLYIQKKINEVVEKTKNNSKLNFVIALSYSGRWEIVEAAKKLAQDCIDKKISVEEINSEIFEKHLTTTEIPDPELLIRTSGEVRISNFLLYQIAYSELYFTDVLWPDFSQKDFYEAIISYQKRERRFGKIGDQIKK